MSSITSWLRIEPRNVDGDLQPGVEARLHDPLWLLSRQWQLGELFGEDGGSAISARARLDVGRIESWTLPIESVVEAGGPRAEVPQASLRGRARMGIELLTRLKRAHAFATASAVVQAFPLSLPTEIYPQLDARDRDFFEVMRNRSCDAWAVAQALRTARPGLPPQIDILAERAPALEVVDSWLGWLELAEPRTGAGSWRPENLDYRATASASLAGRELTLTAPAHHGNVLGWWSFDAENIGPSTSPAETDTVSAMPAPVEYRGMPARRYWAFEDGAVNWGEVSAASGDILHMLLAEFAVGFADDWLQLPIECHLGTLVSIRSLVVTDVFGVQTLVRSAAARGWRGFEVTGSGALLVSPQISKLEGAVLEKVRFGRNELSNLAWAVEEQSQGADGAVRAQSTSSTRATAPIPGSLPRYQLGPDLPEGWHPYRATPATRGVQLVRAMLPAHVPRPVTSIVTEATAVSESELGAGDVRIETRDRLVRDPVGRYHVWRARRRFAETAGPTPVVRFDRLVTQEEP